MPLAQMQQCQVPTQQTVAPGAPTVLTAKNLPSFRNGFFINHGSVLFMITMDLGYWLSPLAGWQLIQAAGGKGGVVRRSPSPSAHLGQKNQFWSEVGHPAFVCRLKMSIQNGPLHTLPSALLPFWEWQHTLAQELGPPSPSFYLPAPRKRLSKGMWQGKRGAMVGRLPSTHSLSPA